MFSRPFAAFLAVSRVCSAYSLPALRRRRFIVLGVPSSEDMVVYAEARSPIVELVCLLMGRFVW